MTDRTETTRYRLPARYAAGRNAAKKHVRGKIVGRANVSFEEEDWRYILEVAKTIEVTISDVIRWAVADARKQVENDLCETDETPPWMRETSLFERFAHVEIDSDDESL